MEYDDAHWRELHRTIIERIGVKRSLKLFAEAYALTLKPLCYTTGLPCVPGCDGVNCAGLHIPLDQWPLPPLDPRT